MAIDAIDDAVMSRLLNDATLTSLAPGRVHRDVAPEGTIEIGRFVVVNLQLEDDVPEQGGTAHVIARYQVKVVDRATTKTAAQAALDRIVALLHDAQYAIAGHTLMVSHKVARFALVELDADKVWQHRGIDLEVWADPS